jgi:hypothetical protein
MMVSVSRTVTSLLNLFFRKNAALLLGFLLLLLLLLENLDIDMLGRMVHGLRRGETRVKEAVLELAWRLRLVGARFMLAALGRVQSGVLVEHVESFMMVLFTLP